MPTNVGDPCRLARRARRQTLADRDAWRHAPGRGTSVDVSGDVDTYVAARVVIDDAPHPYCEVARSEQEAGELDAARIDQMLDGRAPTTDPLDGQTRDAVRARAQRAADQTRERRIAAVVHRSRQLGLDETRPMGRDGRRPAGHGPTSAAPDGRHSRGMQGCTRLLGSWLCGGLGARRGGPGVLERVASDGGVGGCDPCG